jgi:hypothetical protein
MLNLNSQTEIKTMFYNLLNYPTAPPSNRGAILKNILNGYEPDLFMVCELENNTAANDILDFSLADINKNYNRAQFVLNQSDPNNDNQLQQLVYFNSDFFILDSQDIIITPVRDINHYKFILKTADYLTNPIYLEVFVTHLKSSQGTSNQQLRLQMVEEFAAALADLDPNSFVIFAGDFNFYTSSEPGYQKILDDSNAIVIKDILNINNSLQSWHNNSSWQALHTQSTRISNSGFGGFGAGGGLDDRFDFIMLSENILNDTSIQYISDSYQSYGNNNNCFNNRIDDTDCDGVFDGNLRNSLYNMSDHLPVVLSLESNETLSITNNIKPTFIQFTNGNLVKNGLTLTIDSSLIQSNLHIYNTLGQEIFNTKINSNLLRINTSHFFNGVYFIKVAGVSSVLKFIVNQNNLN